jgi:hypothetical protein
MFVYRSLYSIIALLKLNGTICLSASQASQQTHERCSVISVSDDVRRKFLGLWRLWKAMNKNTLGRVQGTELEYAVQSQISWEPAHHHGARLSEHFNRHQNRKLKYGPTDSVRHTTICYAP